MGGFGSGPFKTTRKATVYDLRSLDIERLNKLDALTEGAEWHRNWFGKGSPEQALLSVQRIDTRYSNGRLQYQVRNATDLLEKVPVTLPNNLFVDWRPCRFGGHRPLFVCSSCGHRRVKLFLHHKFKCRKCLGLIYPCQSLRGADLLEFKAKKLRAKLHDNGDIYDDLPDRPKHMHIRTYERLIEALDEIESAADHAFMKRLGTAFGRRLT
ncbi:MAG: hypothetical protein AAGD43_03260 [Pseudomonadota bacterium]